MGIERDASPVCAERDASVAVGAQDHGTGAGEPVNDLGVRVTVAVSGSGGDDSESRTGGANQGFGGRSAAAVVSDLEHLNGSDAGFPDNLFLNTALGIAGEQEGVAAVPDDERKRVIVAWRAVMRRVRRGRENLQRGSAEGEWRTAAEVAHCHLMRASGVQQAIQIGALSQAGEPKLSRTEVLN